MAKSLAERICYGAFDIVENRTDKNAMEVFEEAMKNITPLVEVKARRVGGANYQFRLKSGRIEGRLWLLDG